MRGEAALGAGWTAGADIRAAIGSREQDGAGSVALRLRFLRALWRYFRLVAAIAARPAKPVGATIWAAL